jgi:outer membrane protein TolC
MRRFYQLLFLLAFVPALVKAQEQNKQTFTLDECIQYALQNSVNAKNSTLDLEIAENVILERKSEGLPQISGNVALRHNQKLPPAFFKKEIAFGFSPGEKTQEAYDNFLPNLANDDVVTQPNFFQLPSSGDAGVSVSQLIFNSSYFLGLRAMKTYRELAVRTAAQTKEQIIVNVTKAYYGVLINKDRMILFDNNITRVDSLLKNTKALNENGFAEEIDVDRITVTQNNLISERDKFYNLQELGIQLLKFQMNYPMDKPLDVAGDIASIQVDENILSNYASSWDYDQRIDYQILETNYSLQKLDIKAKRAKSVPTLNAFYNVGYQTQSNDIAGLFRTNSSIPNDPAYAAFGVDKWYQYSNYGLTLQIPIFSGMRQYATVQQAKLNQAKLENSFTLLKASIDLETKQSAINYINATKSLQAQEQNRVLAEKVARITKIKYEQGVGSNIEVIDAESSLKETQVNYYNALYDALIAKVDLDKSYGKLTPQTTVENK